MKKLQITDPQKCFGCSACSLICPEKAIAMEENDKGFLYPSVGESCIECNLCLKVCPANTPNVSREAKEITALQNKNSDIRMKSSSGGVFSALAYCVLEQKGAVYGVCYDENFDTVHCRTDNIEGLLAMRGSKYVQSSLLDTFSSVGKDLADNLNVLFSGTSCQCDGLQHYLEMKNIASDNLITVAVLCHGVPSPVFFHEHIKHIERVRGKKVTDYKNREKVHGWHEHNECIHYSDGSREWRTKLSQNFKDLFYLNVILRECCYTCPYAENPTAADIVIGDYWGMEYYCKDKDDNKGTSIVLTVTEKGGKILRLISGDVISIKVNPETALKYNHHFPCKKPQFAENFWQDYRMHGYEYIVSKYADYNFAGKLKWRFKKELRRILVKIRIIPA